MFYDFKVNLMKKSIIINDLYQTIDELIIDRVINCDIQPSTFETIKKTFGDDTKSLFIMFSDADIKLGSVVEYDKTLFKINRKIDWIDYKIYSLGDYKC